MQPLRMDHLTSKGVETHRLRTSDLEHHLFYPWEVAQSTVSHKASNVHVDNIHGHHTHNHVF